MGPERAEAFLPQIAAHKFTSPDAGLPQRSVQASRPSRRLSDGTAHPSSSLAAGRGGSQRNGTSAGYEAGDLGTARPPWALEAAGDARRKLLSHPSPRHRGSGGASFSVCYIQSRKAQCAIDHCFMFIILGFVSFWSS